MRLASFVPFRPVAYHQGGWDEALLIFGLPVSLFVLLRWLAGRKRSQESDEAGDG